VRRAALLLALAVASCAAPREDEPEYVPPALGGPARDGEGVAAVTTRGALDLAGCLRLARETNRRLDVGARRVLIAEDRVDETIAGVLPRLTAEGRFNARSNDVGVKREGSPSLSFQEREIGTASLSAIVPLYSFGRAGNAHTAASLGVEVAALELERARQDLALAVTDAYFRVLEAQKIAAVVEASIEVVARQLEIARDFVANDLVSRSDALAVEVQLAEREQERILARNNIALAQAALNRLIGRDVTRPTELVDVLEVERPARGRLEDALRVAIERRPDLEVARRRIAIAQAQYRRARADYFPIIYAFGSYNYTTDDFQLNDDWLAGGAAVEWPLFDGGQTYTRVQQREKEIDEAVDLRDERIDDALLEVYQAHLEQGAAAERLPVARKAIELAEENLRIIRDQYAQGLVTSADVLLEEDRLSRARSGYYRALYAYHQALARLENAVGASSPEGP
jgi:outer membrane protein